MTPCLLAYVPSFVNEDVTNIICFSTHKLLTHASGIVGDSVKHRLSNVNGDVKHLTGLGNQSLIVQDHVLIEDDVNFFYAATG